VRPKRNMPPEDLVRIQHMIQAAEAAQRFIAGQQRVDLDTDEVLLFALVRSVEIIGEAASNVSRATCEPASSVPWRDIVSMRNGLIHAYFDIEREIVWNGNGGTTGPANSTARPRERLRLPWQSPTSWPGAIDSLH
jgi:uncharacterized protein with HEPN domain